MRSAAAFATLLLVAAATAAPQTPSVSALQQWTSEGDFHSPTGVRAGLQAGIWTFSIEHAHDSQRRDAVYCLSLEPPDADCDPQASRITSRLTSFHIGLGSRVGVVTGRFECGLVLMRADWRSLVSAAKFNDEQGYLSVGMSVDVRRRIISDLDLIAGSAARVWIVPAVAQCVDCAILYDDTTFAAVISIGLAYRL